MDQTHSTEAHSSTETYFENPSLLSELSGAPPDPEASQPQTSFQSQTTESTKIDTIDWELLILTLRHLEIRILEVLYLPQARPLALAQMYRKLRPLGFCQRTIRRKLDKLQKLHLLTMIRSTVTLICPIPNLQRNIKTLTMLWNLRDRNL